MESDSENSDNSEKTVDSKVEADPAQLKLSHYDDVIEAKAWPGLKFPLHLGLIGATTSGKTHTFKTFLADGKFPPVDTYLIIGDAPGKGELAVGCAASEFVHGDDWTKKTYYHYPIEELDKAISYVFNTKDTAEKKLMFIGDALIGSGSNRTKIANFINKAKNYKCSVVVEIHDLNGENMSLLRAGLAVKVYLNMGNMQLKNALGIHVNDPIMTKYTGLARFDKVVISDADLGLFNKHYLPFN